MREQQSASGAEATGEEQASNTRMMTLLSSEVRQLLGTGLEGEDRALHLEDEEDDEDYEDVEGGVDEDDEDDDDYDYFPVAGAHGKWFEDVKEPKKEGLELLMGGGFGRIGHQLKSRSNQSSVCQALSGFRSRLRPIPREDTTAVSRTLQFALNQSNLCHRTSCRIPMV